VVEAAAVLKAEPMVVDTIEPMVVAVTERTVESCSVELTQNSGEAYDSEDVDVVNDILTQAVRNAMVKAAAHATVDVSLVKNASSDKITDAKIAEAVVAATDFVFKIVKDAILVASKIVVVKENNDPSNEETTKEVSEKAVEKFTQVIAKALDQTNDTTNTEGPAELVTRNTKQSLEISSSDLDTSAKNNQVKGTSSKQVKSCRPENDDEVDEPVAKKVCLETMSVLVIDTGRGDGLVVESYIFKFYKADIPLSVWVQLTALKAAGKTFFPQVGNCGYDVLLPKSQKRADRRDFDTFFKQVIDDDNILSETSQMDKVWGCTFGICLVDE